MRTPRVLSIAGTDPTGGAGLHADLKSIGALGGYGMGVVTALVSQNTQGVRDVHLPPLEFLRSQLDAVSDDVTIDAVKLGMLHSAPVIAVVRDWLDTNRPPVVVLDPVMVATSGDRLLDEVSEQAIRDFVPLADLVTPNLSELGVLINEPAASSWDEALAQATTLAQISGTVVLLKGGHLEGERSNDAIVTADGSTIVRGDRVATKNTHGTGCSLSSAMATLAAGGADWTTALTHAKTWLTGALEASDALEVGAGNGPIDHFHDTRATSPAAPGTKWTDAMWKATVDIRAAVDECEFVRRLGDGTLERVRFLWYLEQDALYLGEYSRALALASSIAPTSAEQAFWASSANTAIVEEAALHRSYIDDASPEAALTTTAYTDHLHASGSRGSYAELVAGILPCFWLYADVGDHLAAQNCDGHPYGDWLETYADEDFAAATRQAIEFADAAAATASEATLARMATAFRRSMQLELEFFRAPLSIVE